MTGQEGHRRCLEVGCGRGSLSAYFADAGWECSLLDISSAVIGRAQVAFEEAGLNARFHVGDCLQLPYEDNSYDLVFSIGLLEHFENIRPVIAEQVRVLDKGGVFIGYIVPHLPDCIQKDYEWVNDLLRALMPQYVEDIITEKAIVYRSDILSPLYLETMKEEGLINCYADGIYPLPMISYSPSFPFTLLPTAAEKSLVKTFDSWLSERTAREGRDPWLCKEGFGQAILVSGRKP